MEPRQYHIDYFPGKTKYLTSKHYPFGHMVAVGDWFDVPAEIKTRVEWAVERANQKYCRTSLLFVVESCLEENKAVCIQVGRD